ncbi:MAG: flagellar protein FlgN [Lachnospiraceae bacterium]|nr:flagellar protein FlgN [Lachnospiraceae bacterium]
MASLIEELISTLSEEKAIYEELVPVARRKTQAIVDNNLDDVRNITEEEQEYVTRVQALEQKRLTVMKNIGLVMNRKGTLKVSDVTEMLDKQPEQKKALTEIQMDLKKVLNELGEVNGHNKVLIEQSLEMISFNMNLLRSTRIVPGNNYTRSAGQWDMTASETGMFDAKQ